MKKLLSLILAGALISALCTACGNGGEPTPPEPPEPPEPPVVSKEPQEVSYYYLRNQKIELKVLKDRVIAKAASFEQAKVLCENEIFIFEGLRWPMEEFIIASIDPETTTIEDVRKLPGVLSAEYGYEDDLGYWYCPTDKIYVSHVHDGTSIETVIKEAGLSDYVEETELMIPIFNAWLVTTNLNLEHILWASVELYETGMCEYAEPAFIREIRAQ